MSKVLLSKNQFSNVQMSISQKYLIGHNPACIIEFYCMNPRDLDIDATINIPTFQRCHSIGLSDRDLLWHSSSLMRSHYLAIYWKKGLVLEQSISTIHLHNLASTSIGCPRAESLSLALIFFSLLLPTYSHIFMHMCTRPRPNSALAFIRETLPFGKKVL